MDKRMWKKRCSYPLSFLDIIEIKPIDEESSVDIKDEGNSRKRLSACIFNMLNSPSFDSENLFRQFGLESKEIC